VATQKFLRHKGIKYRRTEFAGVFGFVFIGTSHRFAGYVEADDDRRTVQVQTLAPVRVSRSKRWEIAELVERINDRLLFGNFELGWETGTVASRTSILLGEGDLQQDVMDRLLFANWALMDAYFPAISAVLFGSVSPKEAIDQIKHQRADPPKKARHNESLGGRRGDILQGSMN